MEDDEEFDYNEMEYRPTEPIEAEDATIPEGRRAWVDEAISVACDITPVTILESREKAPLSGEELEEARRLRQVRVMCRQFLIFADYLTAGVDQAGHLAARCLCILRHVAPDVLQRYGVSVSQAMTLERNHLASVPADARRHALVSFRDIYSARSDEEEEAARAEQANPRFVNVADFRRHRYGEFCRRIAKEAHNLETFPKVLACQLRRIKPQFVEALGDSKASLGRKFGEGRATMHARENRVVEKPMRDAGQVGFRVLGGARSDETREKCRRAQEGNHNRRRPQMLARDPAPTPTGRGGEEEEC